MSQEKLFLISESQIQEIIEATLLAREEPEYCFASSAHRKAENILTNLREHQS